MKAGNSQDRLDAGSRARITFASAKRAAKSNRRQMILYGFLTLLITIAVIFLARYLIQPTSVVFTVTPAEGVEMNFARKLEALVAQGSMRMRIRIVPADTTGQAMADMARAKADLVIGRSDQRLPSQARSVAILDRAVLIAILPKGSHIKTVEAMAGKRIAIINNDVRDSALIRSVLKVYELSPNTILEDRPAEHLSHIFEPAGNNAPVAAIAIINRSRLTNSRVLEDFAHKPGFTLLELNEVKAVEGRLSSVKSETIEAGLIVVKPSTPKEDVETVAADVLLLARSKLSSALISELTRLILENKEDLISKGEFATAIQPPDTNKDARIFAHRGAAEFVNDDTKSFMDRYSDYLYLGLTVLSGIGTMFAALYSTMTRVPPVHASELTDEVMDVTSKIRAAQSLQEVADGEGLLDCLLLDTLSGIKDGSVSTRGFEVFRLAYESSLRVAAERRQMLGAGDGAPHTPAQRAASANITDMVFNTASPNPVQADQS